MIVGLAVFDGNAAPQGNNGAVLYSSSILPQLSTSLSVAACSPRNPADQNPTTIRWIYTYKHPSPIRWIRPHVTTSNATDDSWELLVLDESGTIVDRLRASDLVDADGWVGRVYGGTFTIEVISTQQVETQICIDKVNVDSPQAEISVKAYTGDHPRTVELHHDNPYYAFRNPVAILYFQDVEGTETNCTAFALTQNVIVTNYHCISSKKQLRNAQVVFSYEFDVPTSAYLQRKVISLPVPSNKDLDYSLLQLDQPVSASFVSRINAGDPKTNESLILMQHPESHLKMIVTDGCLINKVNAVGTAVTDSDFYHLCDSLDGSSGSPVMNLQGEVVGLHHIYQYQNNVGHFFNLALK